jgi:hypothetical protein
MEPSDWLAVREYLREHRHELTARAARLYPREARVAGTPLLSAPGWLPAAPIPLRDVAIEFRPDAAAAPRTGSPPGPTPGSPSGPPLGYAETMRALAPPAVFENRPTYRLTGVDLPRLVFGRGWYFDGIDTGEAVAHELAAGQTRVRDAIGDPLDLTRRPANLAISTLTIRQARDGRAGFLLHWRDPAKVGHAGGMYQVVPVGVFQPAADEAADFDLWRCLIREFAEELAGHGEDYGGRIDYGAWPFARRMTEALDTGQLRAWCLGLGVDPLSFATDLLMVVVIDAEVFDELFGVAAKENAEGRVLAVRSFDAGTVTRTVQDEPLQAAGAAVLRLAWANRAALGLG